MRSQAGQSEWVLQLLGTADKGRFFLDIGAFDGVEFSNTIELEQEFGWQGICVEPVRFLDLVRNRRCTCWRAFCTDSKEPRTEMIDAGGLARSVAYRHHDGADGPLVTVPNMSLTRILEQEQTPAIVDYLSLDVEGAELEVLRSLDLERYRFRAITMEINKPTAAAAVKYLEEAGYRHVQDFYIKPEHLRGWHGSPITLDYGFIHVSFSELLDKAAQRAESIGETQVTNRLGGDDICEAVNAPKNRMQPAATEPNLPAPLESPLIIVCAGMNRAGSTWLFNTIRYLQAMVGRTVYSSWVSEYDGDRSENVHVIKIHDYSESLAKQADYVITARRDLRDVVASLVRLDWLQCEQAVVKAQNIVESHEQWLEVTDYELIYEELIADRLQVTGDLAQKLDLQLTPLEVEQVMRQVDLLRCPESDGHDLVTLLFPNHRQDGRHGYSSEVLPEEVVLAIESEYSSWLNRFGYTSKE